jgi:hypothetical protein
MARALTAGELTSLRSDGQRVRLFLAIHSPASVFTARVNGDPSTDDKVASIVYDGGSAGYADAIAGQTVYVGSGAGAYDKGIVRLRGALSDTSGTMLIGETSEIAWADDDYLTVVNEFALWPRHLRINASGVIYMDYATVYSDQHDACDPVPVLGPPAVVWLTKSTVDVTFDASDSWVVGSSITDYAWVASSGSWDNAASATPTLTLSAAGTHRVQCTLTAANGKGYTGYRTVFVYSHASMPETNFRLENCSGDWNTGGWSFKITMFADADTTSVRDRAQVILFARDWYGGTETSIGPVADRENIIATGWIAGESITWDPEQGTVSFDVHGPQWWLSQMPGFPSGVEDYDGTPTDWVEFEDLTVDKGLWHFLHWRTTASLCMDYTLTGDTREIKVFDAPAGSLWQQLYQAAHATILAQPCCDRYGRLFVQIDSQFLAEADRAGIPIVQAITKQDWREQIGIERRTVDRTGQVDLSGVAYASGSGTAYFSLAPGHVPKLYGGLERPDRLALSSQNQANLLAGLLMGNYNNPYPRITINLASNHRAFDVCPHQYGTLTVAAADTERGIAFTDQKIVPRRVDFIHDADDGTLLADIDAEAYTTAQGYVTGDPPPAPPDPPPPPAPPIPWEPPAEAPTVAMAVVMTPNHVARSFDWYGSASPTWETVEIGLTAPLALSCLRAFDVAPDGQAYLVCYDASNPSTTGLFYCTNIAGDSPQWSLLLSVADARTEAGYTDEFESVGATDDGKGYVVFTSNAYPNERIGFWVVTAGAVSAFDPGSSDPLARALPDGFQYSLCASGNSVYASAGSPYYESAGHVFKFPEGTWTKATYGTNPLRRVGCVSQQHAIGDTTGQGDIYDHTVDLDTPVYTYAYPLYRLLEIGETPNLMYVHYSADTYHKHLYLDGEEFADPELVFGADKFGAGFDCVGDSTDEVIWLCDATDPGIVAITFTENGGSTWASKFGNWTAAVGDWTTSISGLYKPMVRLVYV